MKKSKINIQGTEIMLFTENENDFISITDIARYKNKETTGLVISHWLRARYTIEFMGFWEQMHNPDFNVTEFGNIKNQSGSNSFVLTVKQWVEKTNAIGIVSKAGRYGGTYAHKDIAFEFASWISAEFKLYLIKEFQRLKEIETNQYNLEWNVKRILSKTNYHIQTDAVKNFILPEKNYEKDKEWIVYAEEADLLNVALFNCTAKDWREANPELSNNMNIRDIASINELAVLSNLESLNAEMIKSIIIKEKRFEKLNEIANYQLNVLNEKDFMKSLKKLDDKVYTGKQKKLK